MYNPSEQPDIYESFLENNIRYFVSKPLKIRELKSALTDINKQHGIYKHKQLNAESFITEDMSEKSVLVAEDIKTNRVLICNLIKQILPSVKVYEAENGIKALEMYQLYQPSLVLTDIQMPDMDGFQLAEAIRETESDQDRHTPLIALTAATYTGDREKCLNAGMDSYISKPIEYEELENMLKQYLSE